MVRSLPLRNGFFQTPQLTESDEADLLTWGRSLVVDLHHPDAEWTIVHEKKGVQVCEDRQKGGLTYSVRALATVKATLDDIMDMFLTTTTAEYRALMQMQLREYFADSAVLYQKDQNESESLSIKWVAMRSKKTAIDPTTKSHDFCLMEYAGVIGGAIVGGRAEGSDGSAEKPIGVCVYESIEQQECPSLYESHRLERGTISKCGYIFRPRNEEGTVEVQFVCSIRQPPNQRGKRRLNRAILLNWAESVGAIEESISRKRISRDLMLRRQPTWVKDSDRQCCHLCLKTFTNTRRRHHCRACGEVICRACSLYKSVDLQSVGMTTLRVCKACMDGTNTIEKDTAAMLNRATSSVSSSSEIRFPDDDVIRDAVEEYALALPSQQISTVPDLVGIAWLRQISARDPSKKDAINNLMERLNIEDGQNEGDKGEQVDIYDTLCDLAAQTLACKYAVVSLVDENRQWFKSAVNVKESDVPRDFSFCEYPVRDQRPLVVMDTLRDARFSNNPFVTGPLAVRFLAGAPLFTVDNVCVGAVCVLDTEPRQSLQESQIATMQNLAHLAMVMVQERREAQNRIARATAANSQLVMAGRQMHPLHQGGGGGSYHSHHHSNGQMSYGDSSPGPYGSSDLVPLSSYSGDHAMVVQNNVQRPKEDPVLKEQMIQLLQKASQVRDQVNLQSQNNGAQQAGLQSSGE